jgi:hypothetical protein
MPYSQVRWQHGCQGGGRHRLTMGQVPWYLGMEIDLEATGPRAHQTLLQKIKAHLSHLLQQPASPDVSPQFFSYSEINELEAEGVSRARHTIQCHLPTNPGSP